MENVVLAYSFKKTNSQYLMFYGSYERIVKLVYISENKSTGWWGGDYKHYDDLTIHSGKMITN